MTQTSRPETASHPYASLPASRFWKSAVAEIDFTQLDEIWQPRFPITEETAIATTGSCFAQHIGEALRRHGFNWIDAEPAPPDLPPGQHAAQGYGVFSFRLGNIYTAGLLAQWLRWAAGRATPPEEVFAEGGRYFDPFRPRIPEEGYPSPEALREARSRSLDAMAHTLTNTDLFIFTLGLTEAWRDRCGTLYPMCPGTLRGEFRPGEHLFHNFTQEEVVRDLEDAFALLHGFNPAMKFLLTVSPVPLTATATPQHVLVATTHSKAVLRAAAGELAGRRDDVDYFPSYELIASPPACGRFFEANQRSVRREGVDFVMSRFLAGVRGELVAPASQPVASAPAALAAGDEICDDLVLETWSRSVAPVRTSAPPNLYLIGDSQMGMLARVLDEDGIRYAGGAIMQASEWLANAFTMTNDGMLFQPTLERPQAIWATAGAQLRERLTQHGGEPALIITNVGSHASMMLVRTKGGGDSPFDQMLRETYPFGLPTQLPSFLIAGFLFSIRLQHLQLLRRFVDTGIPVVWVSDPPTQPLFPEILTAFDAILANFAAKSGCVVVNTREWVAGLGGLPESFRSTEIDPVSGKSDWLHAAPAFYRELFRHICRERGFEPQRVGESPQFPVVAD